MYTLKSSSFLNNSGGHTSSKIILKHKNINTSVKQKIDDKMFIEFVTKISGLRFELNEKENDILNNCILRRLHLLISGKTNEKLC